MTTEQQMQENSRIQEESMLRSEKIDCRKKALEIAKYVHGSIGYTVVNDPALAVPELLKSAYQIYEWLMEPVTPIL